MRAIRVSNKMFREILSFDAVDIIRGERMSLINANIPLNTPSTMSKEQFIKAGMQSFGMFGGSGNNNTPQTHMTAADVIPKPEDYLNVPYRFISETIVGGESWKATDFRSPGVLKASVALLNGKTLFTDHEQSADNVAGLITDTYWQEGFVAEDGTLIPGGINGNASIDTKTNYNLARAVASGALKSNSVTTAFDWEPSHKFSDIREFYEKLGSFGKDGQMIARKVTQVLDYFESSLLWMGADPFSKKLDSKGQPIHVDKTSVYFSKANEGEKYLYEEEKTFAVFAGNDKEIISLSKSTAKQPTTQLTKQDKNMKKFLAAFILAFGTQLKLSFTAVEGEDVTPEQEAELTTALGNLALKADKEPETLSEADKNLLDFAKNLKTLNDKKEEVAFTYDAATKLEVVVLTKADKAALDTQVIDLTKKVEELEPVATAALKLKRDETLRLAKLANKGTLSAAIEKNINDANLELLDSLLLQYGKENIMMYKPSCTKCGTSDSIEMRSTVDVTEEKKEETVTEVLTTNDLRNRFKKNNLFS